MMTKTVYVTVCDNCLTAACWQGEFMCEKSAGAGTLDLDVRYLQTCALEHPQYWAQGRTAGWACTKADDGRPCLCDNFRLCGNAYPMRQHPGGDA